MTCGERASEGKDLTPRTLDLRSIEDLAYLEAAVDMAPTLSSRRDFGDPLTDQWRQALKTLITLAKEAARARTAVEVANQ